MPSPRIASLAVSAFALVGLTAAGPSNPAASPGPIVPGPYDQPGVPGYTGNTDAWRSAAEAAMNAPQLFRFPGLSNKGCSAGNTSRGPGEYNSRSGPVSGRPQVVSAFPAKGAVVRPGLVVVRVTFDRPMSCDASFGGSSDLPNPCPGRWREVTISADRRSFRTVCEVKADMRYRLPVRSFRSVHDALATPYDLTFSTSGTAPVATIREALAEDVGGEAVAGG